MTATLTDPAPAGMKPRKLGLAQYSGFAAGDAANNLAFSMASMFLLLYYTEVVGIKAAAVGTLFLLVRFWDAFADLFAGSWVDRTSTRLGKFRPFILFGSVPLLLLSVAVFSVPAGLGMGWKYAYMYLSYALLGLAYSIVNIPYGSLAAAMTQAPTERARLATWRVWGSNLTILMLALVVAPQIKSSGNLQRSLTLTTLAFVVVGAALYLYTVVTAREQVQRDVEHVKLGQALNTMRHNRPLLLLCLSSLMFLTAWFSLQTVGAFYARDVLGNANLYILITVVQTAGTFLVAGFVPALTRTLGKKNSYLALAAVTMIAGVSLTVAPSSVPAVAVTCFFFLGIGLGGVNTIMWALEADTVEYGEYTSGIRTEGTTYALFSFTRKMGQALGGAAAAYTIGFGGFVSGKGVVQGDSAVQAIRYAAGAVPVGFIVLAFVIMAFYPLTEKRFGEYVAAIAARRADEARRSAHRSVLDIATAASTTALVAAPGVAQV